MTTWSIFNVNLWYSYRLFKVFLMPTWNIIRPGRRLPIESPLWGRRAMMEWSVGPGPTMVLTRLYPMLLLLTLKLVAMVVSATTAWWSTSITVVRIGPRLHMFQKFRIFWTLSNNESRIMRGRFVFIINMLFQYKHGPKRIKRRMLHQRSKCTIYGG